ncbi:MAG: PPC domain-containing protein [Synechococcales cyanobacterium C42_A2020_086]|jgi:hypothetical protein|nr:PPC domain-containing protein [Synechococcales cyanobacterium C42_A2020_086]
MATDNRLSSARNVGALSGIRIFKDSVGLRDKNDYYTFTITRRSSFNLSLKNLKSDIDVSLIRNGKAIANSSEKESRPEKITRTLEAGTYYIHVYQRRGESKYQLKLQATPLTQPTSSDLYSNAFLTGLSVVSFCGRTNDPTSCNTLERSKSILWSGCGQGNQDACSFLQQLTDLENAAKLTGFITSF